MAFANARQAGFRKALKWAMEQKEQIKDTPPLENIWSEGLTETGTKLYDLLVGLTDL